MGYSDYVARRRAYRTARTASVYVLLFAVLCAAVALFPYRAAYVFYLRHLSPGLSGKAVIEISGAITEYPSGKPIEGAFVMPYFYKVLTSGYYVGNKVCQGALAVRTDAQGRYRFRWDWQAHGLEIPDRMTIRMPVYVPGMNYWPKPKPGQSAGIDQPNFQLSRDDAPFAERLDWLQRMNQLECYAAMSGEEFARFLRNIYAEYQGTFCSALGRDDASVTYLTYVKSEGVLLGMHRRHLRAVSPPKSDKQWRELRAHVQKEIRASVPDYPWPRGYLEGERNPPRDFSASEKRVLCAALAPEQMTWSTEP
jgi:hypothetical protein